MEKGEIKDIAITLLQTLINATGAEFEEENYAVDIIVKTIEEIVKQKKREEITHKEYAEACKVVNSFKEQCQNTRNSRREKKSDDIESLLFEKRKELASAYDFERRVINSEYCNSYLCLSLRDETRQDIKELLKRKFKK